MLAWMDLEMTGLNPSVHVICEIASLITDDDLNVIAEGPDLVIHVAKSDLGAMSEVVRHMHTRSGLLVAMESSGLSLQQAGEQTLEFLRAHIDEPGTVPLAGNSIGVDRRFLAMQLPAVEEFLHYRSIDVSTIKELARRWLPDVADGAPKKQGSHRAMDDIKESVAELAYYRANAFRSHADR